MPAPASFTDLLADCLDWCDALTEAQAEHGAAHLRWTPPQDAWLRLNPRSGVKLFRAGNQAIGKTTAAMQEVDWRATGTHPHYRTRRPPTESWVICSSWSQSVAIQTKFWELCDRSRLTKDTRERFRSDIGWGKDNPTVLYECGSIVRFRTTNQKAKALAGSSVHYIHIDEPTTETVFRELRKRVMRTRGAMGVTLTPVNWDCAYLQAEVESGSPTSESLGPGLTLTQGGTIDEVHARLVPENLIPLGSGRPLDLYDPTSNTLIPMDAAWIAEVRRSTPAQWAPVILDGEWEAAPEGVFFRNFDAKKHKIEVGNLNPARGPIRWAIGFDYAAADRPLGHCAVLCQVQDYIDDRGRTRQRILAVDEVALDGTSSNEHFARDVVSMLERHGKRWSDLAAANGDNPVTSRWVKKSNIATMQAIAAELGIPYNALQPRILSAKDDVSSHAAYDASNQWLFERIGADAFFVHARCKTLVEGLSTWNYDRKHPLKDIVDACRYSLKPWAFPTAQGPVKVRVRS